MKKKFFLPATLAALMGVAYLAKPATPQNEELSEIQLANVEALADDESTSYGCGYAAYEWDNDWYEDTKHFSKCKKGCPEGSGTSPKYIFC